MSNWGKWGELQHKAASFPSLRSGTSGQTCTYVVFSQLGQACREDGRFFWLAATFCSLVVNSNLY